MDLAEKDLPIDSAESLEDLEILQSGLRQADLVQKYNLYIPQKHNLSFFRDSRIAALLMFAKKKINNFTIKDYRDEWPDDSVPDLYQRTLLGVTACLLVGELQNAQGLVIPTDLARNNFIDIIRKRKGVLESVLPSIEKNDSFDGQSVTICCFDPSNPEPIELKNLHHKSELFAEALVPHILSLTPHHPDKTTSIANNPMIRLIYELYQNGHEHGSVDENGRKTFGIRFIQIKKHFALDDSLLDRAAGFSVLEQYLKSSMPKPGEYGFFEVNIYDSGLGILDRFTTQTYHRPSESLSAVKSLTLLYELLFTDLSSNESISGAGLGIPNALREIQHLAGFVSLRTDQYWVYRSFGPNDQDPAQFDYMYNVKSDLNLVHSVGTHYNMLFPTPI